MFVTGPLYSFFVQSYFTKNYICHCIYPTLSRNQAYLDILWELNKKL
jgi:hypothetical protein